MSALFNNCILLVLEEWGLQPSTLLRIIFSRTKSDLIGWSNSNYAYAGKLSRDWIWMNIKNTIVL